MLENLPEVVLQNGDRLRAFAEYYGIFEAAGENERVAILLDLLGRKVRVLLDTRAVEAA